MWGWKLLDDFLHSDMQSYLTQIPHPSQVEILIIMYDYYNW